MNPPHLLDIARLLAGGTGSANPGRPRQTELCRAVSATYYAMFHALALCGANMLAGTTRANRSQPAWRQTYRALEHGPARNQCSNTAVMARFPQEIQDFGELFTSMQRLRHYADYDPEARFTRDRVLQLIDETARIIDRFDNVSTQDRRAFAILVLFRLRAN